MPYLLCTLFIAVLAATVSVSWLATKLLQAREEKTTVEMLGKADVYVYYPYEWANGEPPGPRWLRRLFGDAFFRTGKPVLVGQGHGDSFYIATSLSALKELVIDRPQIEDADLAYLLRALRKLETVRLEGLENITAKGLLPLQDLPLLRSLRWNDCGTSEDLIESIARLNQLKELHFWDSSLSDAGMRRLACMSQLERVSISGMQLPATALPCISQLTHLNRLDLSSTPVGDAGMRELSCMQQLEELDLRSTKVTDEGLLSLSGLSNLRVIDVRATTITEEGVATFRGRAPNVRVFYLPVRGPMRLE